MIDLGRMFLSGTSLRRSRWHVGGRRTMWRMSSTQALIFIAVIVVAVALLVLLAR
jgi:hypothetical protein